MHSNDTQDHCDGESITVDRGPSTYLVLTLYADGGFSVAGMVDGELVGDMEGDFQ